MSDYAYLCLTMSIYVCLCLSMSFYIYLCPSIFFYIYPSIHPSIHPCLSIYLSIHPNLSIYVYLSLSIYLCLSVFLSICIPLSIYIYHISIYLCPSMSIYVYLSMSLCLCLSLSIYLWRRKFRSQTSDLWTDSATVARAVKGEKESEEQESEERRSSAQKCRKVAEHCVFPMSCGSGGSTHRPAEAACVEPCGRIGNQELQAAVVRRMFWSRKEVHTSKARSSCPSQTDESPRVRSTFGEKVHAAAVWSNFWSQNGQNASGPEHFWKLKSSKRFKKHILNFEVKKC